MVSQMPSGILYKCMQSFSFSNDKKEKKTLKMKTKARCSIIDEWKMKNMLCIHNGNHSKPEEELLSFLTTWLNLRGIMLNKKR